MPSPSNERDASRAREIVFVLTTLALAGALWILVDRL